MNSLSRRQLLQGLPAASLALLAGCGRWPGQAQPSARVARVGVLAVNSRGITLGADALFLGLADLGYVEGHNLTIEWRSADGILERRLAVARELVELQPDVIVVPSTSDAQVMREVTSTIPIVVGGTSGDLVREELAESLARPGGNVTGLSTPISLIGKRLQLLKESVPGLSRLAVLSSPDSPIMRPDEYQPLARTLGIEMLYFGVHVPEDLKPAVDAAKRAEVSGLYVAGAALLTRNRATILALAAAYRLPTMYTYRVYVEDGGLMAYQHRITDAWRRAAAHVDRILKGARPADIPIEQPMIFDFVVNMKTARELGITLPNEIMLQVTEVIE